MSECKYKKPNYFSLLILYFVWLGFCYQLGVLSHDNTQDQYDAWWAIKQVFVAPFRIGALAADQYFTIVKRKDGEQP